MNLFNSTQTYYGLFETHTLMKSFNCFFNDLDKVIAKVTTADGRTYSDNWEKLTPDELIVLTTDVHEHDHFIQFISTPFGILLWRCYQVLIRDTFTLINYLKEYGIQVDVRDQRLLDWWEKKGRELYAPHREKDNNYTEEFVVAEMRLIDTFLNILLSPHAPKTYASFTVGRFVDLVNDLYPRLAQRSGLTWQVRWKTEFADSMLFGDQSCGFNVLSIIEGMSKLREHIVLLKNRENPEANVSWWKGTLHGYYKEGYDFAIAHFYPAGIERESSKHMGHAHSLYVSTLCGNIDIACPAYFFRELYVEREFPWFRAKTLSNPGTILFLRSEMSHSLKRILCKNELFTKYAQWDTKEIRLVLPVTGEELEVPEFMRQFMHIRALHFRQVEEHFFAAHKLLFESLESGLSVGGELAKLGLIDEYNDRFNFINTPKDEDISFLISWLVPVHIAYQQQFMLNLFYGVRSKPPEAVGKKFLESLKIQFPNTLSKLQPAEQEAFEDFFSTALMQSWLPVDLADFLES